MNEIYHVLHNKEKDLWYIVPIKQGFMSTINDLMYEKKEVIFIGDGRSKREQVEDLVELVCMDDGYGKYYIHIISKLIFSYED